MLCPKCKSKIVTINTVNSENNEVFRQRKCTVCGYSFFTSEFEIEDNPQFRKEYGHLCYLKKIGKGVK